MSARRARIALYGAMQHRWQSVDRTRRFYLDALGAPFDLVLLCDDEPPPSDVGAVVSFSGSGGWRHLAPQSVPHLFAVHGGATLDHEALRENASRLRSSDTFIVNCTSDEAILTSLFDGDAPRFCRLPLPANDACWVDVSRGEAREALPFRDSPDLVIGFIARLLPQKNLHLFLRMFAELRVRLAPRRVDAVVVGEYWADYPVLPYMTRDYRAYVASLAHSLGVSDAVTYLGGGLSDDDLRLVYGALDVLVHPTWSIDENFGYVPVEAMACGVPVVGAAYGGLKDTVSPGESGYLMSCWTTASGTRIDFVAGVDDVARLLRDRELYARLSAGARARAVAEYARDACSAKLIRGVSDALEAGDRRSPLRAASAPSRLPVAGYLPPLEIGWEYYWPSVERYAGRLPILRHDTRLCLFAPASFEDGRATFDDPAWPASIEMTEREARICAACQSPVRLDRIGADASVVAELVQKGALIASNGREMPA